MKKSTLLRTWGILVLALCPTAATAQSSNGLERGLLPLIILFTFVLFFILRSAMAEAKIALNRFTALLACAGALLSWVWPLGAFLYGLVGLFILTGFNLKLMGEKRPAWYWLGPSPLRAIKPEEMNTVISALAMLVPTTISFVVRVAVIADDI